MSLDVAQLGFSVDSSQLDRGARSLDKFGASSRGAAAAADLAKKAFFGFAAAMSVQSLGLAASSYDSMTNSLKVLGLQGDQVTKTLSDIGGIASRTRTPIESMANLYQRTSIAARELGVSQQEILGFTETVGTALAVQGTSAQQASGALQQLTQALAGGVVRAEEFNSILEGAPTLVMAAAQGIDEAGGSVGRLRQLMLEGEITSREFFDAILSQSGALQEQLGMTSVTIGQAFTNLSNGFTQLIGALNSGTGVTATFAAAINALGVGMGNLANYLQENGEVLQRITSYAAAAAAIYGGTLAVSLGTTLVKATMSAVSSQIALEMALGATSKTAAVASIATKAFAGALGVLKKALIATGIGAVVVAVGELINWFRKVVQVTGGVGKAFSALGDLAGLVWQGIVDSAAAIPPGLAYVWQTIQSGFLNVIQSLQFAWAKFIKVILDGVRAINGMELFGMSVEVPGAVLDRLSSSYVSALNTSTATLKAANDAALGAAASAKEAGGIIRDAFAPAASKLSELTTITEEVTSSANDAGGAAAKAGEKGSKGAGKAAKATKDLLAELNKELDARQELIGLTDDERAAKEALQTVQQKLGDEIGNYSQAAIQAADRIVAIEQEEERWQTYTNRVGEFTDIMTDGLFSGFKDTLGSIKDMFIGWLKQMISLALKNKIIVSVGAQFGATGGGLMQQVGGLLGGDPLAGALSNAGVVGVAGGGMLSGLLGSWGGSGGLLGGLSSVVTGLTSGGIGGAVSAIGSSLAGATTGLAGLAGAVGALAGPIGLAAAAVSFFTGKTKELDRGLRINIDSYDNLVDRFSSDTGFNGPGEEFDDAVNKFNEGLAGIVESYTKSEKSKFGGLSKKKKFNDDPVFGDDADAILDPINNIITSVLDMAGALGVGGEAFRNFTGELWVSTKGLSDGEAQAAVAEALVGFTNDFAAMIPGIEQYQLANEGAADTLTRLTQSLGAVNPLLSALGHTLYDVSLAGADAASKLAQAFGGLDAMQSATATYYDLFYSDAEKLRNLVDQTNVVFAEFGVAAPTNAQAYRDLIEAQDLSTEAGMKAYASMIQLAPMMDQIFAAQIEQENQRIAMIDTLANATGNLSSVTDGLEAQFAAVGATVPNTVAGLIDFVKALDLTDEAAQRLFTMLNSQLTKAKEAGVIEANSASASTPAITSTRTSSYSSGVSSRSSAQQKADQRKAERERLQEQLWQLQGREDLIRKADLKALDKRNRALQKEIWALEDAKKAMDALNPRNFRTLADYQLAAARKAQEILRPGRVEEQEKIRAKEAEDAKKAAEEARKEARRSNSIFMMFLPYLADLYRLQRDGQAA